MSRRLAIWLLVLLVFLGCVIAAAASAGGASDDLAAPLERNGVSYDGSEIQSGDGDVTVAVVPVIGAVMNGDSSPDGSTTGAADFVRMLDAIAEDEDRFDGVILELDTPGGGVLAAQEMHDAVERLKRDTDLPVLAWMRDVTASAGYYVSAPTDRIVAAGTTLTGSIGVILEYVEGAELADKVGVKPVVIKSGKLKDMGSPFRAITPDERAVLQSVIDEAYDEFVGVVADGRELSEAEVRELADGRIYSGRQAKEIGLVDELGIRADAYDAMAKLIGRRDGESIKGEDLEVVEFGRRFGFFDTIAAGVSPTLDGLRAAGELAGFATGTAVPDRTGSFAAGNGLVRLQYRAELGA